MRNRLENRHMNFSESSFEEMTGTIRKALSVFRTQSDNKVVTDIHILASQESGEFSVSDDDKQLASAVISDFADLPRDRFTSMLEETLRSVLRKLDREEPFEQLSIWKPFSFVLTDDDGETISELMLLDDDSALASPTLLEGLDDDLDQFLRDLLS